MIINIIFNIGIYNNIKYLKTFKKSLINISLINI